MFDLDEERLLERAKKRSAVRSKDFGRVRISPKGTRLYHGLGAVPKIISIQPLDIYIVGGALPTWVLDPAPNSKYITIKSSVDADFLVYVAGGL